MNNDNGGPAFPRQHAVADANDPAFKQGCAGMTLRDYFAAKAMQSLILEGAGFNADPNQIEPMTATAYDWADAMLKARAQ